VSFFRRAGALIARFFTSAADPAAATDEFQLYSKGSLGDTQLFGRSSSGAVHQITPAGGGLTFDMGSDFTNGFKGWNTTQSSAGVTFAPGQPQPIADGGNGPGTGIVIVGVPSLPTPETAIVSWDYEGFTSTTNIMIGDAVGMQPGIVSTQWRIGFNAQPPSANEDWDIVFGLFNQFAPADRFGVTFRAGIENGVSPNWFACVRGTAAVIAVDTGVAVDLTSELHTFDIVVDPTAAATTFYIDGVLVATLAMPADYVGVVLQIYTFAGDSGVSSGLTYFLDYATSLYTRFSNP
jgi:hypothetical protein